MNFSEEDNIVLLKSPSHSSLQLREEKAESKYICRKIMSSLNFTIRSGVALATIQSPYFLTFMEPRNLFQGVNSASLCSQAGRYYNPIPPRFLAPIDCLKIPAQYTALWHC
jgi:hypothetical protein